MSGRRFAVLAPLLILLSGCPNENPEPGSAATARFQGVKSGQAAVKNPFCEQSFAPGVRHYVPPPERPLGNVPTPDPKAWRWINLWATWCAPCMEEMPLIGRWREALTREGLPVALELVSVDAPENEAKLREMLAAKTLPGPVRWLRGLDDLGPYMEALGLGHDTNIPVHALIDPAGNVRCVRVGAIHEELYGALRTLVASP